MNSSATAWRRSNSTTRPRGAWKVGQASRDREQFAFAVFDGIVQEVYQVLDWYPAGSTFSTREYTRTEVRWEFVGSIAEEAVRNRYRLRSVRSHIMKGAQSPIRSVFPQGSWGGL